MIRTIELKGFQSHVDSKFELQNGLNVITGPSDSGKTAIIRAVRWLAFNEPQGEAFVNEAVGEAEVRITLTNNAIITKTRKSSKTSYRIQTDETDKGSIFEKADVPLEVTNLLGIEKQTFGDFEAALNFSFQLDPPFLISETASAGAKILGKLAGTESVDLAIRGVSKDTHATRINRSQAEKDIERISGSLLDYLGIDDAKQSLETAELLMEQVEASNTKFESLKEYRIALLAARVTLTGILETLDKLAHVPDLEKDMQDIEKSQQRYDSLLQLYSDGNRLEARINELGQTLKTYEDIELGSDLLDNTSLNTDRLSNINTLRQLYQKHVHDVKVSEETLNKTKDIELALKGLDDTVLMINNVTDLRNTKVEYETTLNELNTLNTRLSTFKDMHMFELTLTAVDRDEKRLAELKELYSDLKTSKYHFKQMKENYSAVSRSLDAYVKDLEQAWDEAGGVCPLCNQTIGGNCNHEN